MNTIRLLHRLCRYIPIVGYVVLVSEWVKKFPKIPLLHRATYVLENTLLYFSVGAWLGIEINSLIVPMQLILSVALLIFAFGAPLEFLLIRRWGHKFPEWFGWSRHQRELTFKEFITGVFQSFCFLSIGLVTVLAVV